MTAQNRNACQPDTVHVALHLPYLRLLGHFQLAANPATSAQLRGVNSTERLTSYVQMLLEVTQVQLRSSDVELYIFACRTPRNQWQTNKRLQHHSQQHLQMPSEAHVGVAVALRIRLSRSPCCRHAAVQGYCMIPIACSRVRAMCWLDPQLPVLR